MNIGIYQTVNAHAPAIHWWLAHERQFGPQLYYGLNPVHKDEHIGSIVQEIRDEGIDPVLYDTHQESLREMENKQAINNIVDCTSVYFDSQKGLWGNEEDPIVGYAYPVWSNYFGSTISPQAVPLADKLIFAAATVKESAMFYITQYAFNNIKDEKSVTDHSKIWWEDHMLMGGNNIGKWKEVWYRDYHDQCIQDATDGKLKYMWQLNFAHWDLFEALQGNGKFKLDYSPTRLFKDKHKQDDLKAQNNTIKSMVDNNVDHLVIGPDWFKHTDTILDYLGLSNSETLIQTALLYGERYTEVINAYEKIYNKYYKGN